MHNQQVLDANARSSLGVSRKVVPGEEEAYLAFTLNAFKEIVEKYGVKKIVDQLDPQTFSDLHFYLNA